jgi:hypothetical protein
MIGWTHLILHFMCQNAEAIRKTAGTVVNKEFGGGIVSLSWNDLGEDDEVTKARCRHDDDISSEQAGILPGLSEVGLGALVLDGFRAKRKWLRVWVAFGLRVIRWLQPHRVASNRAWHSISNGNHHGADVALTKVSHPQSSPATELRTVGNRTESPCELDCWLLYSWRR